MKKRFYDFSLANALIVLLAYGFIFILSIYSITHSESPSLTSLLILIGLGLTFLWIIGYYGLFPVTLTTKGVHHFNKNIPIENLVWSIKPNYRLRYDEIIFRNNTIQYDGLTNKQIKKHEIRVQYFPKYGIFLEEHVDFRGKREDGLDGKTN